MLVFMVAEKPSLAQSISKILSNNQLTTLDKDTFSGLVNLRELRLDDNQIQTLDKDILRDLTKLEWIGVSNNQLETLDSDTFAGLNKAQEIYLHNNKFGENLELNLEESVKFISFRTGQDQWDPSNDIEFISKVNYFFLSIYNYCFLKFIIAFALK